MTIIIIIIIFITTTTIIIIISSSSSSITIIILITIMILIIYVSQLSQVELSRTVFISTSNFFYFGIILGFCIGELHLQIDNLAMMVEMMVVVKMMIRKLYINLNNYPSIFYIYLSIISIIYLSIYLSIPLPFPHNYSYYHQLFSATLSFVSDLN